MAAVGHLDLRRSTEGGEDDDGALVRRAQQGDSAAFALLYRRHLQRMFALAFRLLPRREDADDLTQDAFAQAFETLHLLRDPDAFAGWLRSIVVRTAAKRLRRQSIARRLGLYHLDEYDIDGLVSDTTPPEVACELRTLYRQLHRIPGDAGVALVLQRVMGLSVPEIAHHLGLSRATVNRRIRLARARLGLEDT